MVDIDRPETLRLRKGMQDCNCTKVEKIATMSNDLKHLDRKCQEICADINALRTGNNDGLTELRSQLAQFAQAMSITANSVKTLQTELDNKARKSSLVSVKDALEAATGGLEGVDSRFEDEFSKLWDLVNNPETGYNKRLLDMENWKDADDAHKSARFKAMSTILAFLSILVALIAVIASWFK